MENILFYQKDGAPLLIDLFDNSKDRLDQNRERPNEAHQSIKRVGWTLSPSNSEHLLFSPTEGPCLTGFSSPPIWEKF